MATSMALKPERIAISTSRIDAPFSRYKVDDALLLKVAQNLTGHRQYTAIRKIEEAMEKGTTMSPKGRVLVELIRCAKKGGMISDCIFVALENLATDEKLKGHVLKVMDHLINNGAAPSAKESAQMSKERIHTWHEAARKPIPRSSPLVEGHI